MKNPNFQKKLSERKAYINEKRKGKKYQNEKQFLFSKHLINVEKRLLKKRRSPIYDYLEKTNVFEGLEAENKIIFPKIFSLTENFEESFNKIIQTIYSYEQSYNQNIVLSFKKCKKVEITCLFILDNIFNVIFKHKKKLQPSFKIDLNNTVEVQKSKNSTVNKRLCVFSNKLLFELDFPDSELLPVSRKSYSGSKNSKSYVESSKKKATTKIRDFIKETLWKNTSFELTETGINLFEGLISETIDNSEQHSFYGGEWYATTYLFEDSTEFIEEKVVEVQIHFLNFGVSIYDSLNNTKDMNQEMFSMLDKLSSDIISKDNSFKQSNLISLLALNEGVSSLHYKDESRGTGTIKLLESFFQIGDYENTDRKIHPLMIILSGDTLIKIDNNYKCYKRDDSGKINVSLNDTNNISDPPSKSHLINLNKKFPGTLISIRVFLNEHNLQTKNSQKNNAQ
ncbi:hypothetical protein DIS18_05005 [Algibacter marinivivus]|uniref:Uncharacterized protein n=1 Tax=Algibacter marinivivus TaxID=2100723 RepID=A0A2U2X7Y2_9FLAO|nr:hypothetical protein [Algibacter marinivivus]PWH83915.1 hypothetical protein DIS18_05005 [Algibacter marinivivus]